MLNIFAIDPEICRNPEWFRYCTEHCHPSQGRMIADLPPGSWSLKVREIIQKLLQDQIFSSKEGARQKRRLARVIGKTGNPGRQLVDRPGTDWDYLEPSWITNTENEHERKPFSLIVSPFYEEEEEDKLKYHPAELDITVKAWHTDSGMSITRSPGKFVDAILPMLQVASEIHFLDRYFTGAPDRSYIGHYERIIRNLASNCDSFPSPLTIHCCPDSEHLDLDHFKNELKKLKKRYESLIPIGKSVTVFLWQIKKTIKDKGLGGAHPFHNRYVLTDHWGVIVGAGTNSANKETDARDDLAFISEKRYTELWKNRKNKTHPMMCLENKNGFVINGTKSA